MTLSMSWAVDELAFDELAVDEMAVGESPPHQEDRWRQDNNEMYEQTDEKWMKKRLLKAQTLKTF